MTVSLERRGEVSQVKAWVWRMTGWGTLFRLSEWLVRASARTQTRTVVGFWGTSGFCFRAGWGKPALMLKIWADAQETRALFTALLQIFIQGLWQMVKPDQLLWWGIWWPLVRWLSISECLRWLTPCCVQFSPPLPPAFLSPLLLFLFTWLASSQTLRRRGGHHAAAEEQGRINTKYPEQSLFP